MAVRSAAALGSLFPSGNRVVRAAPLRRLGNNGTFPASGATTPPPEFGLVWSAALETGGVLVGEKVEITIELEAVKKVAAAPVAA
jgi:hypothetical protein